MIKEIKRHNPQQFLDDLKSVGTVMVLSHKTSAFFTITKRELLEQAARSPIKYHMSEKIFLRRRTVLVVE